MNFFFFNDTATTEIYTLSLHDALPIFRWDAAARQPLKTPVRFTSRIVRHSSGVASANGVTPAIDRKSTRLNSSHANISYAVFCLKKKKYQPVQTGPHKTKVTTARIATD